ncbi:hypothetical protein P43SY_003148 [Pythium insidiosum]|uniref:Equilibrative Nucleoside Transporter (ENT) Family n=1 Tax=Pythium insidiosum TaxID=114742 RepID=A0AAD5LC91_PYTIN|nr:hypothetical protein P43SY_003148 [Pythium insidiosum]
MLVSGHEREANETSDRSHDAASATRRRKASLTLDLDFVGHREAADAVDTTSSAWNVGFVVTYCAFFFAGASTVAMWSSLTLCLDVFTAKYPDERVGFVFPVVNMSTLLVISLYMVLLGRHLPLEPRINGSLAAYLLFIVLLPLVNVLPLGSTAAYTLTILALIGSTISSSVMQASYYGLGGVFGPLFLQALDGGKGFGAILLFVVRLGLKRFYQPSDQSDLAHAERSMGVFFGVTLWIVAATWALYCAMKCTRFAQPLMREYLLLQSAVPVGSPVFSPVNTPLTGSPRRIFRFPSERSPLLQFNTLDWEPALTFTSHAEASARSLDDGGGATNEEQDDADLGSMEGELKPRASSLASSALIAVVFRTAAKPFFTLFLSFFVCLSCFPGVISAIPSVTLHLGDWFPIVLVGGYNVGDLIGKNLPVRVMWLDLHSLHLPWTLQLAFVPFFLAALLHPFSDAAVFVATCLLGFVTGYVATTSMILAPSLCAETEREAAGMIGSLCAIVGLCAGSYNGLALETLVQLWQASKST